MGKKYRHGSTADEYTDSFIDGIVGDAPSRESTKENQPRRMGATEHREWTESIYSEQKLKKRVTCSCGSVSVFAFSVLLALIGLAIIIFAIIQKKEKLIPLCPKCDSVINGMYIGGSAIILVAAMGIAAAKLRHKACAVPYTLCLVILACCFFAAGITAVVFRTGVKSLNVRPLWEDAVRNDPDFICTVQENLKCSGFDRCCYTNTTQTSVPQPPTPSAFVEILNNASDYCFITDYNGTIPAWATEQCIHSCQYNTYKTTCSSALEDQIKRHMIPFIGAVFGVCALLVIMSVVSLKMTRLGEDAYDYGGRELN